jgi:hypothetical protein
MEAIDLVKRKSDHKQVPSGEEDLALELSDEGRRRFGEMTEKSPQPGAAKRRIDKQEAGLAESHEKRAAAAASARQQARPSGMAQPV